MLRRQLPVYSVQASCIAAKSHHLLPPYLVHNDRLQPSNIILLTRLSLPNGLTDTVRHNQPSLSLASSSGFFLKTLA